LKKQVGKNQEMGQKVGREFVYAVLGKRNMKFLNGERRSKTLGPSKNFGAVFQPR
jgi:ABC-type sugar transport system ATPase subunit